MVTVISWWAPDAVAVTTGRALDGCCYLLVGSDAC